MEIPAGICLEDAVQRLSQGSMAALQNEDVVWLESSIMKRIPWVKSATTTRLGGVSSGHAGDMNFCVNEFDTIDNVLENRRIFAGAAGFDASSFVLSQQVHGTEIAVVGEKDMKHDYLWRMEKFGEVDGMVTDVPGAVLACFSADCCIVSLADAANRAIGLVHAGWRGTLMKIAACALDLMWREYGTDPKDVVASISPSICKECFEVGEDVAEAARTAFDESALELVLTPDASKPGKYRFDIWEANAGILEEAGVRPDSIEKPELCTCCNPDLLFSHRASLGKRGTLMTVLQIVED